MLQQYQVAKLCSNAAGGKALQYQPDDALQLPALLQLAMLYSMSQLMLCSILLHSRQHCSATSDQ